MAGRLVQPLRQLRPGPLTAIGEDGKVQLGKKVPASQQAARLFNAQPLVNGSPHPARHKVSKASSHANNLQIPFQDGRSRGQSSREIRGFLHPDTGAFREVQYFQRLTR